MPGGAARRRGFETTELGGQPQRCLFDEGMYINHGPWRIPYHHRSTLHYAKLFGVPLEIMVNDNDNAYVLYENAEGPFKNRRVRRGEVKADMRGYTAEMLAKAVRQDKLDTELSADDKESLVTYLVSEGYLDDWASWEDEGLESSYPKLLEPDGRVFLAGEHLSYLTGWQAGAIESAWHQLEKLHQRAQGDTAQRSAVSAA